MNTETNEIQICDRCHRSSRMPNRDEIFICGCGPEPSRDKEGQYIYDYSKAYFEQAEISLLIIDLGDSCVVKVEKGHIIEMVLDGSSYSPPEGSLKIWDYPFSEVRSAIDGTDAEPPVPRIERLPSDSVRIFLQRDKTIDLTMEDMMDLKSLKMEVYTACIYEPKGKWTQLLSPNDGTAGITVWRYIH